MELMGHESRLFDITADLSFEISVEIIALGLPIRREPTSERSYG